MFGGQQNNSWGFGKPATTTSSSIFGGTNTGFGATSSNTSVFGAPASTGTSTFGATPFGTTTSTASTGFGFGTGATTTGAFGTTANTGNTGFGSTGAPLSTTFGAPASTGLNQGTAGTSFGQSTFGGFGTGATGTTGSAFGSTGTSGFQGGFGAGSNSFSFGKPTTSFGAQPAAFGGTFSGIGQPQQANQNQSIQDATAIATAVTVPMIYQDERDKILAMFNQLQAKWGIGKGYHSQSGMPVLFTADNPFCKFRTIGYNALPTYRPEEGLVCLLINKKIDDVKSASPSFTEILHRDVIKSPNISVFLDSINDMGNNQTQVVVYVYEKSPTGTGRKFTSCELMAALEQCKAALSTLAVINMAEMTETTKNAVEQYLANPPPGIDSLLWEQAKSDNPDPTKLIPVPLIGFEDLSRRMKFQSDYQERQKARLEMMSQEAVELEKKCDLSRTRVEEIKEKQHKIAHRVLKLMSTLEVNRKLGVGIQGEEETLKASLEEILREVEFLNVGKLNELQVTVKSAPRSDINGASVSEEPLSEEVLKLVQEQQKGLMTLIQLIQEDSKKLDEMSKSLSNPEV